MNIQTKAEHDHISRAVPNEPSHHRIEVTLAGKTEATQIPVMLSGNERRPRLRRPFGSSALRNRTPIQHQLRPSTDRLHRARPEQADRPQPGEPELRQPDPHRLHSRRQPHRHSARTIHRTSTAQHPVHSDVERCRPPNPLGRTRLNRPAQLSGIRAKLHPRTGGYPRLLLQRRIHRPRRRRQPAGHHPLPVPDHLGHTPYSARPRPHIHQQPAHSDILSAPVTRRRQPR